jgi:Dirigent-like protein
MKFYHTGRAQGTVAVVGLDESLETMLNFIFTHGKYNGSSLAIYGRVVRGETAERPVIGGTGMFRLAQGYCIATPLYSSESKLLYEYDVYVWYKNIN